MGLAVMLLTQLGACCSICVVVVLTILLHEQDGTAGDTIGAVEGAAYHTYQNRATASIDCGEKHLVLAAVTGERPTDQWAQLLSRQSDVQIEEVLADDLFFPQPPQILGAPVPHEDAHLRGVGVGERADLNLERCSVSAPRRYVISATRMMRRSKCA